MTTHYYTNFHENVSKLAINETLTRPKCQYCNNVNGPTDIDTDIQDLQRDYVVLPNNAKRSFILHTLYLSL